MGRDGGGPRVIVALDYSDAASALALVSRLSPDLCRLKVGKELFTAAGPALVQDLVQRRFDVFLDLKYHDIPNTVAQACRAAAALGAWMLNVHALGGRAMMRAAREALEGDRAPRLIAVTVLTSHAQSDLDEIGIQGSPQSAAVRLAGLARECGLDGVVCSAQEAPALRAAHGPAFLLVTPGIRLASAATDDQKRITTPRAAVECGASYLVVGRPVTRASEPLAALSEINREIERAAAGGRVEDA
ncbi:MAG TPA: orotidine-5'-phosphate decarboxylase [Burkholderiales bacterium]|nr:orotidine-5'-phosphate decarboxylase [Burkholderiales bacterium]